MAVARKVSPQAHQQKFTECLNPVIWYFRIIGYPLNYNLASKFVRIIIIANCLAMLAFDAWVHIDDMIGIIMPETLNQYQSPTSTSNFTSTAKSLITAQFYTTPTPPLPNSTTNNFASTSQSPASTTISSSESMQSTYGTFSLAEIINRTVLVTSVHLIFIWICLFGTWSKLWNRLKQLEAFNLSFDTGLLRRAIILGFVVNVLDMALSAFAASQVGPMKQAGGPIKKKVIIFLTFLSKYFPVATGMIFCILTVIAISFYHALRNDIKETATINKAAMDKWRAGLLLVDRFIEGINEAFGPVLLMIFAFMFFDFISNSYDLVLRIKNNSKTPVEYLFTTIEFLLKIVEFCSMAEDVAFALRKTSTDNSYLRHEADVSSLCLIVFHPEVTAMGLFDINLQLIPTLIGTTVTYVIIMYQFDA